MCRCPPGWGGGRVAPYARYTIKSTKMLLSILRWIKNNNGSSILAGALEILIFMVVSWVFSSSIRLHPESGHNCGIPRRFFWDSIFQLSLLCQRGASINRFCSNFFVHSLLLLVHWSLAATINLFYIFIYFYLRNFENGPFAISI